MRNKNLAERMLSLFLAVMLMVGMMSVPVYADEGEDTELEITEEMYTLTAYSGEYDGDSHPVVTFKAASGYEALTAKYSDTENGTFTEDAPTITAVGEQTVYVQISGEGYVTTTVSAIAQVSLITNTVTFETTDDQTITYSAGGTFKNTATATSGAVSYSSSNTDVATVNASTGEVSVLKPGETTITAKVLAEGNYAEGADSYKLTVKPMTNAVTFANGDQSFYYSDAKGLTYTNKATADSNGAVSYSSSNPEVATVDSDGKVTFSKPGTVAIKAMVEASGNYAAGSASYTIEGKEKGTLSISFAESDVKAVYGDKITTQALGASETDKVIYSIASETLDDEKYDVADITEDGKLTVNSAGVVVICASIAETEDTKSATATYTLTIERATPTVTLDETEKTVTYSADLESITYPTVQALKVNDKTINIPTNISYSIAQSRDGETVTDVVTINEENKTMTVNAAGEVAITVTVPATDKTQETTATYILTVNRAAQSVSFMDENPEAVAYGATLANPINAGTIKDDATVTYEVVPSNENNANATVNESGVVKVTAADGGGKSITVRATIAETTRYAEVTKDYTFTTALANQEAVKINSVANPYYGTREIQLTTTGGSGTGAVQWAIKTGTDIATVDQNGKVTFVDQKMGLVTITATKAGDSDYKAASEAEVSFEVVEFALTGDAYTVEENENAPNEWYVDSDGITLTAETGYSLSMSNSFGATNTFGETLTLNSESEGPYTIYVKTPEGYIIEKTVEVQLDKTAPTKLKIELSKTLIQWFWQKSVTVTISAIENVSGMASFVYNINGVFDSATDVTIDANDLEYNSDTDTYSYSFQIDAEYKNKVVAGAINNAGLSSQVTTDGIIVVDSKAPSIMLGYTPDANGDTSKHQYQSVTNAVISITEENFFAEDVIVTITRDDIPLQGSALTWDDTEHPVHKAKIDNSLFETEGVYAISIELTDRSQNKGETFTASFTIDRTAPKIVVDYDNDAANSGNLFKADRVATIKITEHNFDENLVSITTGTADDGTTPVISEWTENQPDVYQATVTFAKDGDYIFNVDCKDPAGNEDAGIAFAESTVAATEFTIDKTAPIVEVKFDNNAVESEKYFRSGRVATITITEHNFDKNLVSINTGKADDGTAPSISKLVPVDGQTDVYEATVTFDKEGDYSFTVDCKDLADNENKGVQFAEGTNAGKEFTIDKTNPVVSIKYIKTQNPDSEYSTTYNASRTMEITIVEHNFDANRVFLNITNTDGVVPSLSAWSHSGDTHTATITYTADGDYNFSVSCRDMAGNNSNTVSDAFTIDTTAPVISISYKNTSADSTYSDYYDAARTATITIVEHNFDAARVSLKVTNTDNSVPSLSSWSHSGNTHTATLNYTADGDYEFSISCRDKAGNGSNTVKDSFTIDRTVPTVSVSYDNNEALNGNYYRDTRTATITVKEHNFVSSRVTVTMTATDNGEATTVPAVSGWSNNGDTHTATIYYAGDALYTFDISVQDMAGNSLNDFAQQTFYVDKTAPEIVISGVESESANNGDVIPVVRYTDTNIDLSSIVITLTGANRGKVKLEGVYENIENGQVFTFDNFEAIEKVDDIYTLTATLTDFAGNETTQTIVFSVNRFGSTYVLNSETAAINGTYIQKPIDIEIIETNVDALSHIKIVLHKNGESITLVEGEDYEVELTGGNGKWYKYTYIIHKENFQDDAVYSLTIYSEDAAGNVAENTLDTKGVEINFGVDKTPPTAFVANLEDGATYAVEVITAILSAQDNLALASVDVYLDDELYVTWSEEEIDAILAGNGDFNFDIFDDSNHAHVLRIVCRDAAGNETIVEISDFYVTTNLWIRYYTNEGLFYGSIVGVLLIAALIVWLVARKRKVTTGK